MLMLAAAFLLISGIASLTYQVVWVRLLGLSMGSTSASISTVLAAFFLGLALGSYLAERITRNRIDNLKVYIVLETIIGIAGLALLPILLNLDHVMAAFPAWGSLLEFKFAMAMVLLVVPTMCMGATFPVMAAILVRRKNEVGLRVSQLYSLNTAGAVFGACLAGFVFIPSWGLDGAVYMAASLNFLIVVLAIYLNKRVTFPPIEAPQDVKDKLTSVRKEAIAHEAPLRFHALVVLFATGFVAIATEVGWTKYISIFTGTTIYGFAAILTVFLLGITWGSWAVKSWLDRMHRPEFWMAIGLVLLGLSLLMTRSTLSHLPPLFEALNHYTEGTDVRHGAKYAVVFFMLIIPTFIFGALFPLNLKLYCGNLSGVRARIGKAYAVNTIASIFGSVAAGFWIIPTYGTDALLTAMAFIILVLPFLFIKSLPKLLPRITVTALALLAISSNWFFNHISYEKLIASVQYQFDGFSRSGKKAEVLFVKEGKAGVVSLVTYNGSYVRLQNNGLNESGFNKNDFDEYPVAEYLLGLYPYLLHENPKSAFIVGYGGGFTTKSFTLTEKLEKIKVVELEPAVVEASKFLMDGNIPTLQDPRVTIQFNDARNTLLLEDAKYDLIVSQPSHPWLSRASTVFTREFFEITKSRLNEGGIYGQWLSLFGMDATTMKAIMKAFFEVYPHGFTAANVRTGDFLLFGAVNDLKLDPDRLAERITEEKIFNALKRDNIKRPFDIFWYYALSRTQAVMATADSEPNTDMNILSEVRLSALDGTAKGDEDPYKFLFAHFDFDINELLGEKAGEILYQYAESVFEWEDYQHLKYLKSQIHKADAYLGRVVEHRYLASVQNYDGAIDLYNQHEKWPDESHRHQAEVYIALQRFGDAETSRQKINDKVLNQLVFAKLLYAQGKFEKLATLTAENDEVRAWQLSALAKTDIKMAGEALVKLDNEMVLDIPQLRSIIQFYNTFDDEKGVNVYTRRLVDEIDNKVESLVKIARIALNEKSVSRAKSIITRIEWLNPNADNIGNLRNRADNLERRLAAASKELNASADNEAETEVH